MTGRVVITGVGLHGAFGDVGPTRTALSEGRSAVRPWRVDEADGYPTIAAAPAQPVELSGWLPDRKLRKYMSPATELAVLAAGRALADARLLEDPRREDMGLFVATGLIAFGLSDVTRGLAQTATTDGHMDYDRMGREVLRMCHPLLPFKMLLNMPLGLVSIVYRLHGHNLTFYPGAGAGGACLEAAVRAIGAGRVRRTLVGGAVRSLGLMPVTTGLRLGRVARTPDRAVPFSAGHDGVAPADAGAFLVLESDEAAAERGARVLATLGPVAVAQAHDREQRAGLLPMVWTAACGAQRPSAVLTTGSANAAEDEAESQVAGSVWPDVSLRSHDGQLGHPGAAALPCAVALASGMLEGGPVLVSSSSPDGDLAAVLVSPPTEIP